jgi:hypothetical protein
VSQVLPSSGRRVCPNNQADKPHGHDPPDDTDTNTQIVTTGRGGHGWIPASARLKQHVT